MSSLAIGLDLGGSHVTATLVRVQTSSNPILSIVNDKLYSRAYGKTVDKDPRTIIASWIECIDDLLQDYANAFDDNDIFVGIGCGVPGPMDYERGISYIQSTQLHKCNNFFGLNLRLSLQYGLQQLVSRWKSQLQEKNCTSLNLDKSDSKAQPISELQQSARQISASPSERSHTLNFHTDPIGNERFLQSTTLSNDIKDYCGSNHDCDSCRGNNSQNTCNSKRINEAEASFLSNVPTKFESNSLKLCSIIERLCEVPISFGNDATCFAVSEAHSSHNQDYKRILAMTLGTGFGSTFIDQRKIIVKGHDVPPGGMLWNYPYDENSIADDWFSTRGLIKIYQRILEEQARENYPNAQRNEENQSSLLSADNDNGKLTVQDGYSLAKNAAAGDQNAMKAFQMFARCFGNFLAPHIEKFHADIIVIGGGLAQAWHLIQDEICHTLQKHCKVEVYCSPSHEKSICLGGVHLLLPALSNSKNNSIRETQQALLPVVKAIETSEYDIYPSHEIPTGFIGIGHKQLDEELFRLIEEHKIVLIDGFVGTNFDEYAHQLNKYFCTNMKKNNSSQLMFYDSRTYLKTDTNHKQNSYLQHSKSIFGKVANDLDLKKDFTDLSKLNYLQNNLSYPCVVIGPGASFISETSPLIYIDLSKNELNYRICAQTSCSYLKPANVSHEEEASLDKSDTDDYELTPTMYERKCVCFLDYPVFNKLKQELVNRMTIFVDGQRPNCPTWMHGYTFRQAMLGLADVPIRVRPWFEPGAWGGQWLKSVCKNISQSTKNYAWSFEMITPENGIILSDKDNHLLELSWDLFYGSQAHRILGNDAHYRLFGGANDFPIRFDFLDTMDGGNLSIQCHPSLQYIRKNFGEKITQDETYYIVETKEHWKPEHQNHQNTSSSVYLGFQDNVDPEEFHQALLSSRREHQELDVDRFVQRIPSKVHDFFLIPNETIHASGQNQVVLEISATPYLYTFKLYDWIRFDLNGRLRPLNIEHGMKNLKFDRRGEQLRCQPTTIKYAEDKYEEQHLPTHDLHFYDVARLIIKADESIELVRSTENRFHLCMLVEGDAIQIEFNTVDNPQEKQIRQYNYIETFLIPASIKQYRLRPIVRNKNIHQLVLVITYLKRDCEKLLEEKQIDSLC